MLTYVDAHVASFIDILTPLQMKVSDKLGSELTVADESTKKYPQPFSDSGTYRAFWLFTHEDTDDPEVEFLTLTEV